ncbi:MAG: extracellular solute-binding protein [Cyanobacteriota bacterium]|jgi:arabinogalactan oligomer/maltooligosaccharide transport system substrate-binding protein
MTVLRRWLVPFVLGLVGLQGCGPLPLMNGQTLYVMVVTQRKLGWLRRETVQQDLWDPLLEEFHNLHPNVRVSLYTVDEDEVEDELKRRTARGLGPDLILVRAPMANTLLQEGLIAPVPHTPTMERSVAQVAPRFLARVRQGPELAGLPLYELVTLACFNRQRIPTPPRTTEDLLAMAAAGRTVGLSVDPYGIWWTTGTRDADHALAPLILKETVFSPAERASGLKTITAWLTWLRLLAQQSKVDLSSGPQELTEALKASRLDWIPCFSLTLDLLKASMGDRLGVSALPSGPGGPPSPFTSLQVWSFGLDSSPLQRQYAADLAKLSVDPLLQRRYVLDTQEVLPVNGSVQTPVASSGVLAVLAQAQRQFLAGSPLLSRPFTVDHLNMVASQLETVIQQVMVGVLTPREGAEKIFALRTPPQ